jgi:hypothetical protein
MRARFLALSVVLVLALAGGAWLRLQPVVEAQLDAVRSLIGDVQSPDPVDLRPGRRSTE